MAFLSKIKRHEAPLLFRQLPSLGVQGPGNGQSFLVIGHLHRLDAVAHPKRLSQTGALVSVQYASILIFDDGHNDAKPLNAEA